MVKESETEPQKDMPTCRNLAQYIAQLSAGVSTRGDRRVETIKFLSALKSIGMAPRKVAAIPAKADSDEQKRFLKEELEPCFEEAESGQE